MNQIRSPIDPPLSQPIFSQFLIVSSIVIGVFLILKTDLYAPYILLSLFCFLIICFISLAIFYGFVRPKRKLRQPSEQFERIDWLSSDNELIVRYEKWNEKKSPLVIAIHGWQSDSSSSEYRVQPFLENGYHAVMIDLPGHGFSDGLKFWSAIECGERILAMLSQEAKNWDTNKIASVVLFGHSMGGFISLRHANRMSDLLPVPISRVYLESPMTSFPLVFKQRTSGFKKFARLISRMEMRWAYLRDGPDPDVKWREFQVPEWGIPIIPIRILQAKNDIALGPHHLELLVKNAADDWEIVIDSELQHNGKNRGNAVEQYNVWISN